jgi:hypothetical protein
LDSRGILLFRDGMKLEHIESMNKLKQEMRLPFLEFGTKFSEFMGFEYIPGRSM